MTAMFEYKCSKCGAILKVPKSSIDKNIKCEKCSNEIFAEPAKKNFSLWKMVILVLSLCVGQIALLIILIIIVESEYFEYVAPYAVFILACSVIYVLIVGVRRICKLFLTKKQKPCLWIGVTIIVFMGLFPPVERTRIYPNIRTKYVKHYFIVNAPGRVVLRNLFVEWAIVAIVTGGLIYTFRDKKPKDKQKQ